MQLLLEGRVCQDCWGVWVGSVDRRIGSLGVCNWVLLGLAWLCSK